MGFDCLAENYRCRRGEVDLVMLDSSDATPVTVFVEVRYRRNALHGRPEETISVAKQNKIILTARHYLQAKNTLNALARFDVIAITQPNYLPRINWIKDAFA